MLSSGLGSSSSLLYSQMFSRPLFPLTLGLTITKQRLVQPLTLSVLLIALPSQIVNGKYIQTMYMNPHSPSLPNPPP